MSESHSDLKIRSTLAIIPLGTTIWLALQAEDPYIAVFISFPGLAAVALIIYPSLTSVCGDELNNFLFTQRWNETPKAPLSQIDCLLVENKWDEAETLLIERGREFPHDMEIWTRLFRLAWIQIGDQDRARACHRLALQCTKDPKILKHINHLYTVDGQSHLGFEEEWDKEEESMKRRMLVAKKLLR